MSYNLTIILKYSGRSPYDFKALTISQSSWSTVEGLPVTLKPLWAVLGGSQGSCWRSEGSRIESRPKVAENGPKPERQSDLGGGGPRIRVSVGGLGPRSRKDRKWPKVT